MEKEQNKKTLNRNIKVISGVILLLFVAIMAYMVYFQAFMAEEIAMKPGNVRYVVARNKVLRGPIYDRFGEVLSYSERQEDGKQKRIYQGGEAFAQILGYTRGTVVSGLEQNMDDVLVTDDFEFNIDKENLAEILRDPTKAIHRTKKGNSVVTTLDTQLQKKAYDLLGDTLGEKGSIVALDPKTGEILAMVNRPSYDPNLLDDTFEELNQLNYDDGVFTNNAARGTYAPASTFKIITLISALENLDGVEGRTFNDNGVLDVKVGQDLRNVDGNKYGDISLETAFRVSSNVVFGGLAIELGADKIGSVAERFGFNQVLKIKGFTITDSVFPSSIAKKDDGLIAAAGIGQGSVSTQPLQMAMVAGAIANDGMLLEPRLIRSIQKYDGTTKETFDKKLYNTVADANTSQTVKAYMKNNVDASSNKTMKKLALIRGAGKTGTSQDTYTKTSEEKIDVNNSWFVGFAPYEDPKIAIAVLGIDAGSGSGMAASIATELMTWYVENR